VPPVRVVLDTAFRLPLAGRLASTIDEAPLWVVGSSAADPARRLALEEFGAKTLSVAEMDGGVSVAAALEALGKEGVGTVLVEGGARVAAALLRQGLVHRLHLLIAPRFLGDQGVPAFSGVLPSASGDWVVSGRRSLGEDSMIVFESRAALERLAGRNGH
jgi:diaminohydroxyphosphoribosylaminopyrimidine deaminase/5-amino-6-(5-phosphoribosylamino)uracil reductase